MSDHKFVLRFISLYRSLPELWDRDCEEYPDRTARAAAYQELVHFYRTKYPKATWETIVKKINLVRVNFTKQHKATRETVVKKINSVRVNFRREYNKVEWSKKNGGPVYEPRLYYYEDLLFLVDQEDEENRGYCEDNEMRTVQHESIEEPGTEIQFVGESGEFESVWLPGSKSSAARTLQQLQRPRPSPVLSEDSEEMILARAYALKLTKMAAEQRIFADKLINDVLMEGQLGGLSRASGVVTRPPTALSALPSTEAESSRCDGEEG